MYDNCDKVTIRTDIKAEDIAIVLQMRCSTYHREYGLDIGFGIMTAKALVDFYENYKPEKERCFIAEMNGEVVGCAYMFYANQNDVKLRILGVDPKVRRQGIGSRLVDECVSFAKSVGYQKIIVSSYSVLVHAERIYSKRNFKLTEEVKRNEHGSDLIVQTYELIL